MSRASCIATSRFLTYTVIKQHLAYHVLYLVRIKDNSRQQWKSLRYFMFDIHAQQVLRNWTTQYANSYYGDFL